MKLRIELTWGSGIADEDAVGSVPREPSYDLFDASSGQRLNDEPFDTCNALEAFIRERFGNADRVDPPDAPPQESARLERLLALAENPPPGFDPRHCRAALAGLLYQWRHPAALVGRLRRALGLVGG